MLKPACFLCVVLGLSIGIGSAHASDELCQANSRRMLDHLDKGDYGAATTDFNARMKATLSADRLARIWPAIAAQFGVRGAHERARLDHVQGHAVVITPLHYGQSLIDLRVACTDDGKVAGFHIKPEH